MYLIVCVLQNNNKKMRMLRAPMQMKDSPVNMFLHQLQLVFCKNPLKKIEQNNLEIMPDTLTWIEPLFSNTFEQQVTFFTVHMIFSKI